jgi:dipeptidyl aminopeptidase/acylaminoacyl peptidase
MKKIEINDILKYKYLENLLFNPSGTAYVYNVARADSEKNTYKRDVWAVKDRKPFQLTSTIDASVAFWNSDSELIINRKAPEDEKSDYSELFSISLEGGEAKLWAKLPVALGDIKKVSDGVYAATVRIEEADPDAYLDDDETRKKKKDEKEKDLDKDYDVYTEVPYWANGRGAINGKRSALFIIRQTDDAEKEPEQRFELKRITAPDHSVYDFKVDGNKIYFSGAKASVIPDFFEDLMVYDLEKDELSPLYDKHDMGFEGFQVMDGVVYAFAKDYKTYGINETPHLYRVEKGELSRIEGYEPTHARHNSALGDIALGGGRQAKVIKENDELILYTLSTVEDHTVLSRITLSSGKVETILDMPGNIHFFDMVNERIALCYTGPDCLPEIYLAYKKDLKPIEIADQRSHIPAGSAAELEKVSDHNTENLKDVYVAKPQRLDYESEGLKLHGWVLLPEDFDPSKKYPAVLDVHGGPRCVYCEGFFHEMQVWAAKGFVVMFTNIKGSDGRGDDFADIRGDYGGTDFKNLMAFVDAVLEKYPAIDKDKLCETGGSYGGFMTNWIVTHTDRFCCAASQRSISNWLSMTYISDIGPYFGPDQCGIEFADWFGELNSEALWKHSPLKYVDNAKTPTLFLHSEQDYRCPLPEAMQMMQAMTVRGVETRLIVFHGENHELSRSGKPKHRIRRLEEITGWFEKHI